MQSLEGGSKVGTVVDGRLAVRFPNKVRKRISHRWELTYDDGRDATSVADLAMEAVETFMDQMIATFEQHIPFHHRDRLTEPVTHARSVPDRQANRGEHGGPTSSSQTARRARSGWDHAQRTSQVDDAGWARSSSGPQQETSRAGLAQPARVAGSVGRLDRGPAGQG
jgi:hypothetical protein